MTFATLRSFDQVLRDFYPRDGDRIKQYVIDTRREQAWESETCPRIDVPEHDDNTGAYCRNVGTTQYVPEHDDNTGAYCRNVGTTQWTHLDHDCCSTCGVLYAYTRSAADVTAWLAEKVARPPIESDRDKLSDEIAAVSLLPAPFLAMRP